VYLSVSWLGRGSFRGFRVCSLSGVTYAAGSGLAWMGLVLLDLSRRALSIDGICSLIRSSFKFEGVPLKQYSSLIVEMGNIEIANRLILYSLVYKSEVKYYKRFIKNIRII